MNASKSILIGIDGNEANVAKRVGTSVVCFELLKEFRNLVSDQHRVVIYLRQKPLDDLPKENQYWTYKIIPGPRLWLSLFLPLYLLFHKKPDIYLAPAHYAPSWPKLKIVTIIHDLAFLFFPNEFLKKDLYTLTNWTKKAVSISHKIISVSQATKKDIIENYSLPENKIIVAENGFSPSTTPTSRNSDFNIERLKLDKYLLYVGTLQARKNIPVLIKAYYKLKKDYPDLKLVIAGKKGWFYDEIFAIVRELKLEDEVIFTGFVSDEVRTLLYQNASCFILPSKYEGFGMPILEAMSMGTPVVTTQSSSLPEVGGNAALYAEVDSPASFAAQINLVLSDKYLRENLIQKGYEQIKKFSFSKMSEKIWKVLLESV